jgi:type IV secretory pathway TrbD component
VQALDAPDYRRVYRAVIRPLTICGVDRRLFFLSLLVGAAAFNLFYSLAAGCGLCGAVYLGALVSTRRDPSFLQVLLRSRDCRTRYDAGRGMRD